MKCDVRILWTLYKAMAIFRKQSQSRVPSIAADIFKYSHQTTIEIAELSHWLPTLFIRKMFNDAACILGFHDHLLKVYINLDSSFMQRMGTLSQSYLATVYICNHKILG